jgi:5-methylcytosine-specific restriction endonuclease McrA
VAFPRIDGARVETICPICGVHFWYARSWPLTCCSKQCSMFLRYGMGVPRCEVCTLPMALTRRYPGKRFCSSLCFGRWQSATMSGWRIPRPDKHITRVTIDCGICETPFEAKKSHATKRKYCSRRCGGIALSLNRSGENSWAWRGGYMPYYGPTWRRARRAVMARDVVCQGCGISAEATGRELDVHHIKLFRTFGVERHAEANQLDNLVLLCFSCHARRPEHHAATPA